MYVLGDVLGFVQLPYYVIMIKKSFCTNKWILKGFLKKGHQE
jgi:hypothetical protein